MRTYFVAITFDVDGSFGARYDSVVFTEAQEFVNFCEDKPAFNDLDDCYRLHSERGNQVVARFCILAEGPVEARDRAWDLMHKVQLARKAG